MYERGFTRPEDNVDNFLARGKFDDADAFAKEALDRPNLPSKDRYHLGLKRVALPLFELAYGTKDPRAYDEANDVYAGVGELLEHRLEVLKRRSSALGEVSELTFFSLHLRTPIDDQTPFVIIPASRRKDKKGTDFYFSPPNTKTLNDGWPTQLKTVAREEDKDRYGHVTLVGMTDLDTYASNPLHPRSLTQSILRELKGQATDDDYLRLEAARQKTYDLIAEHENRRGIAGELSRLAWRLAMLQSAPAPQGLVL